MFEPLMRVIKLFASTVAFVYVAPLANVALVIAARSWDASPGTLLVWLNPVINLAYFFLGGGGIADCSLSSQKSLCRSTSFELRMR